MARRILLKLSGEALQGEQKYGIDGTACRKIAAEVADVHRQGVEIAIVVGGGNLFRGAKATGLSLERTPADQIGMLATLMNGIALEQALSSLSLPVRLMSAFLCGTFVETYSWKEATEALDRGTIVIFVGGLGHPYLTTDTTAAMRAVEMKAEVLLKATTVDGVYDRDPKQSANAVKFNRISFAEVLERRLQVMDATAFVLCRENGIPIRVFDLFAEGGLKKVLSDESIGTLVEEG